MSVVEQVKRALEAFGAEREKRVELERLSSFYTRMKREGIASTRSYDLPPLDTIGRRVFENGKSGA